MARSVAALLHPHAEVVVHDVARDEIVAIFNPNSRRKVGDPSYLDRELIEAQTDVVGPYQRTNWDGRPLKCMSTLLRDEAGNVRGFVCINLDVSVFENMKTVLANFVGGLSPMSEGDARFYTENLYQRINRFVEEYCRKKQLAQTHLTRTQKRALILAMKEQGAFDERNAASYIARALDVSRATVYNYVGRPEKASEGRKR